MLDPLLDASVVASFDASGFRRHARSFVPADLEVDLSGQEHVVTGANAGLGRVAAETLAARGARVWMVCRSAERGRQALLAVRARGAAELVVADLSELSSVREAASALPPRVDALIHNAGVLLDSRERTTDGLERTVATHVVGPALLTSLLAPRLGPGSRLVWVSSGGMYARRLDVDRLFQPPEPFDGVLAYARAKRAQVVLADLLAERLPDTWVAAMHPGWADTGGVRRSLPGFHRLTRPILRTPEQGADTVNWLAMARRGPSGRFWFDRREVSAHLLPWTRESQAERESLWRRVCEAAGLDPARFGARG